MRLLKNIETVNIPAGGASISLLTFSQLNLFRFGRLNACFVVP
jgi:hypothetical protein